MTGVLTDWAQTISLILALTVTLVGGLSWINARHHEMMAEHHEMMTALVAQSQKWELKNLAIDHRLGAGGWSREQMERWRNELADKALHPVPYLNGHASSPP